MLISLSRQFIFVANLKTASTSIEVALRPYAEICLAEAHWGKHFVLRDIISTFPWIWNLPGGGYEKYFVFGVIRDPVDYMLSLYNSHTNIRLKPYPALYSGEMTFKQFIQTWVPRNWFQAEPQSQRFVRLDGQLGAHYLISYEQLSHGMAFITKRLGIPGIKHLPKENASPQRLVRRDLDQEDISWIIDHFKTDFAVRRQLCDRLLTPGELTQA
jgi:hypothetical protein